MFSTLPFCFLFQVILVVELGIHFLEANKLKLVRLEAYSADKMPLEVRQVVVYSDHRVPMRLVPILASVHSARPQILVDCSVKINKHLRSLRRYLVPEMLADQYYLDLVQVRKQILTLSDTNIHFTC